MKFWQRFFPIYLRLWPTPYWLAAWTAPYKTTHWKALRITLRKGMHHSDIVAVLKMGQVL